MKIKVINRSPHPLPTHQTDHAAGVDITAFLEKPITLAPLERALIPTGLSIALPPGSEAQIRPRSGLALKYGISMVNAPGTIDADYRGEIGIILINLGQEPFTIRDGERIAQMVIAKHQVVEWQLVKELNQTARGAGGFGHTSQ